MKQGNKFAVGDKVRFTGKFLRSTGQYTGSEGKRVWNVMGIDREFIITDQKKLPEELECFTTEELKADPTLHFRRIHSGNLIKVGKPDHS